MYHYFGTDERIDPCIKKLQSSWNFTVITVLFKEINVAYVRLTQHHKWIIYAMHDKEILNVLTTKIATDITSYVSHVYCTPHEQKHLN